MERVNVTLVILLALQMQKINGVCHIIEDTGVTRVLLQDQFFDCNSSNLFVRLDFVYDLLV